MSHHYSGPDWGFPHGDARLDLTDLYAFPKPGDTGKSILMMNVHPSARDFLDRENPLGPTTVEPFAPEALYELKIDTDGDAVADIAYRVRFSSFEGGSQTATLRRVEGAQAAGTDDGGQTIVEGASVSTGREAQVREAGDYRFFAGWRSDPFFFDRRGALNDLQFTGDDFFADQERVQHRAGASQLCPGVQRGWSVAPHAGSGAWRRRGLGYGGARCAAPATLPRPRSYQCGERCLPRRRAGGRCPFRCRLRARAGAYGWVYDGGSTARGRDNAAGDPAL